MAVGTLTILDACKTATTMIDRSVLMDAAQRGAGGWLAFRGGRPTRTYRRLMALKERCRTVAMLRRAIEQIACCPWCGGEIPTRPTCPNCGAPAGGDEYVG
jgi:hypothetical protein